MTDIKNRYDFALLFDVKDGNPNGDPDTANVPRIDPETSHGLVTDVCLKRKVRNYIQLSKKDEQGYEIYVKERAVLSAQQGRAYEAEKIVVAAPASDDIPESLRAVLTPEAELPEGFEVIEPDEEGGAPKLSFSGLLDKAEVKEALKEIKTTYGAEAQKFVSAVTKLTKPRKPTREEVEKGAAWMCKQFFDVRTFGAVMSLKENNCGQVRGAVQLTFARSLDPIVTSEHTITRVAVATEKEAIKQGGDNRTMGRKNTVPYGLYLGFGFINPLLARQTGFSQEDLDLLWQAFRGMFELDRSAARGLMALRRLIVFRHASELGNAPAHKLFELIHVRRKDPARPPRDFGDYEVKIDATPPGVEMMELTS